MAVPRSESQRERDRLLISELYVQGLTQQQIADKMHLNRNTITSDIKAIKADWKKQRNGIVDEFEGKYRFIYQEAIAAWFRSLEDAETTIQELIDASEPIKEDGFSVSQTQRSKSSTRKEGQSGNPALLAQAQAALKAIREMFGVDVSARQTNLNLDLSSLTNEQLQRIAAGEDPIQVIGSNPGGS